jgi:hypothetical protein
VSRERKERTHDQSSSSSEKKRVLLSQPLSAQRDPLSFCSTFCKAIGAGLVVASSDLHSLCGTARYQKPSRTFRKKKEKKEEETITNENPSNLALASVVVVIWRLETRAPGC